MRTGVHEQDMQMYDSDVNNAATSTSSGEMIDPDKFCFCINFVPAQNDSAPDAGSSVCSCILKGCRCEIN